MESRQIAGRLSGTTGMKVLSRQRVFSEHPPKVAYSGVPEPLGSKKKGGESKFRTQKIWKSGQMPEILENVSKVR